MTGSSKVVLTPDQTNAVQARGQNVLVNAGAGAGKTSTLTRRVIGLLTDEDAPRRLDQLVIVTFTRAAATEMKDRIGAALRARLEEETAKEATDREETSALIAHLEAEVQSLPRAQISTLHSYCAALLREFGDQVGIPPDFEMIDEDEALLIQIDRLREELDLVASDSTYGPMLLDVLTQMNPVSGAGDLQVTLMKLQGFLSSLDDPDAFVRQVLKEADRLETQEGLASSVWHHLLVQPVLDAAGSMELALDTFLEEASSLTLASAGPINVQAAALERHAQLRELLPRGDFFEVVAFLTQDKFLPTRTPPKKNSPDDVRHHELSKILKQSLDDSIEVATPFGELATPEEIRRNLQDSLAFLPLFLSRLGLAFNAMLMAEHMESRRLRFSDLERLTLRLLEDESGLPTSAATAIRERTAEILVDEFQDVNGLQARLLNAIARPHDHPHGGNLFIVGDLKQSIYGFRQADPRKFKQLYRDYKPYAHEEFATPGARIDLVANYRSRPELLALLNPFFERLFSERIGNLEFTQSHQFVAGRQTWDSPLPSPSIDLILIEGNKDSEGDRSGADSNTDVDDDPEGGSEDWHLDPESMAVVAEIVHLRTEGVPLKDIAVLTRTGRAAATKLVAALQHARIPYQTEAETGFLEQQEVLDFKALLLVLDNPFDDVAFVGVLRGPIGEWSEDEIASLRLKSRKGSLIDSFVELAARSVEPLGARAQQLQERLDRWRLAARRRPMGELFLLILEETNLMAKVEALPNGETRRRNLLYLVERAAQFDSFQRKGLREFLDFLEKLSENDRDLGTPPASSSNAEAVRIMTIHKSKGLEFPVVILPYLGTKINVKDLTGHVIWDRDLGVACDFLRGRKWGHDDKNLAKTLIKPAIKDRLLSEELRLLYVAMTRAEQRLILIGMRKATKTVPSFAEGIADWAEKDRSAGAQWRRMAAAKAKSRLDWILVGFADRPEMLSAGDSRSTTTSSLRVRIIPANTLESDMGVEPNDQHAECEKALRLFESERESLVRMIERVNTLSDRREGLRIKVKVSATEAKRIFDQTLEDDGEEEPRVRWTTPASTREEGLPDWWPPSLADQRIKSGKERGVIQHKYMEMLDFTKVTDLDSLIAEARRMVNAEILAPDEVDLIDFRKLHETLTLDPFGPAMLARSQTVRREVPFKVGFPVCDVLHDEELPDDIVMLQGIIDLIYEDARGRLVVVDWKTDRWDGTAERIDQLTKAYQPQILLYMEGLRRATNREVAGGWLVFLQASQPVWISPPQSSEDWMKIVRPAILLPD